MSVKIENREMLLLALEDYPEITLSQKNILKILVNLGTEVNVKTLMDILKLKRQSIYPNLKKLQELGLIISEKKRTQFFGMNNSKIQEIIDFYKKKQSILQNF